MFLIRGAGCFPGHHSSKQPCSPPQPCPPSQSRPPPQPRPSSQSCPPMQPCIPSQRRPPPQPCSPPQPSFSPRSIPAQFVPAQPAASRIRGRSELLRAYRCACPKPFRAFLPKHIWSHLSALVRSSLCALLFSEPFWAFLHAVPDDHSAIPQPFRTSLRAL
jgi:hypothetical protein